MFNERVRIVCHCLYLVVFHKLKFILVFLVFTQNVGTRLGQWRRGRKACCNNNGDFDMQNQSTRVLLFSSPDQLDSSYSAIVTRCYISFFIFSFKIILKYLFSFFIFLDYLPLLTGSVFLI